MNKSKNIIIGVLAVGTLFLLVSIFNGNEEDNSLENFANEESIGVLLPEDIPTHVPMYPNSTLDSVQDIRGEDNVRNITLSLIAEDSTSDVNGWYRGALNQNGWAVVSDRNVGGYILLKSNNQNISVFTQVANYEEDYSKITQRIQIK